MKARESSEWALRFAADWSPWWLLLGVPLLALAAWWFYRRQTKGVPPLAWRTLLVIRIILLAGLLFLAFRPSLLNRRTLVFPGRVLLVVDDSGSMATQDNRLPDAEALRQARRLDPQFSAGTDLSLLPHALADQVAALESSWRSFSRASRGLPRQEDAFWNLAEAQRQALDETFGEITRLLEGAPGLGGEPAKRLAALSTALADQRASLQRLLTGDRDPGATAWDQALDELRGLESELLALQALVDDERLVAGDEARRQVIAEQRAVPRLTQVARYLGQQAATLESQVPNQFLRTVRLSQGELSKVADWAGTPPETRPEPTDLLGRLDALAAEASDFPLAAVVLLSDGRELGQQPLATVARELARRQVQVAVAAVGDTGEPHDLALLRVHAPPLAVVNTPVPMRGELRTSLRAPGPVALELRRGQEVMTQANAELGTRALDRLSLNLTPDLEGLARYTMRLPPVPGEVFPAANNQLDLALQARADKARVLLLDGRPRWETRFATNIFQRLPYLELNALIVLTAEGGLLRRGPQRGAWPTTLDGLAIYDLIVLGDLPPETLTPAEWTMIYERVAVRGGTLCLLGGGEHPLVPPGLPEAQSLLPVRLEAPPLGNLAATTLEDLRLTTAGAWHPLTRALVGAVPVLAEATASSEVLPETQVLLVRVSDGRPLISLRQVGLGKVLYLATDRLWQWLNPTQLAAHTALYAQLPTWAVQGAAVPAEPEAPVTLGLDARVSTSQQPLGVWLSWRAPEQAPPANARIDAIDASEAVVASAPLLLVRPGARLADAVFHNLPPKDLRFRLAGQPDLVSAPVIVLHDDPELKFLSRDQAWLTALTGATGGVLRELSELPRLLQQLEPRERVERRERAWRLWDSPWVLALLALLLTLEWVWRKFVGLV